MGSCFFDIDHIDKTRNSAAEKPAAERYSYRKLETSPDNIAMVSHRRFERRTT